MLDVYVAGVGLTPFGKDERSIGAMLADACRMALSDSASFASECIPDCVVIGSMDPIGFARQTGLSWDLPGILRSTMWNSARQPERQPSNWAPDLFHPTGTSWSASVRR